MHVSFSQAVIEDIQTMAVASEARAWPNIAMSVDESSLLSHNWLPSGGSHTSAHMAATRRQSTMATIDCADEHRQYYQMYLFSRGHIQALLLLMVVRTY